MDRTCVVELDGVSGVMNRVLAKHDVTTNVEAARPHVHRSRVQRATRPVTRTYLRVNEFESHLNRGGSTFLLSDSKNRTNFVPLYRFSFFDRPRTPDYLPNEEKERERERVELNRVSF